MMQSVQGFLHILHFLLTLLLHLFFLALKFLLIHVFTHL